MSNSTPLLALQDLVVAYGSIVALRGVTLHVDKGEIVALIGANGAGKSTLMMSIFGQPRAKEGSIRFQGNDITELPPHEVARQRIAQSPEGRRIFTHMSVYENLQMGAALDNFVHMQEDLAYVYDLFPILKDRANQSAGTLSGGEQQMLAIARALMSRPELLLLDEPSLGLAPIVVGKIFNTIRMLNETRGLTIFLVEQNAYHALQLATRAYVLVNGLITMTGAGRELLDNPDIRAAYLEGK